MSCLVITTFKFLQHFKKGVRWADFNVMVVSGS